MRPRGQAGENDDPCAVAPPAAEEMSGLEVVDDLTFTIKTSEKVSNLPVRLGYTAFAPLPQAFFDDPEGFGQKPISAGPYMVENWAQNQEVVLVKNPEYAGEYPGQVDKITFKIYTDEAAAYADTVAGNIDIIDNIPTDVLPDEVWKDELAATRRPARPASSRTSGSTPRSTRRLPTRRSAPPSRWPSTARRSSTRSSPVPGSPPPAGSPRSSTATRPTSAARTASTTRRPPRPSWTPPAGTTAS